MRRCALFAASSPCSASKRPKIERRLREWQIEAVWPERQHHHQHLDYLGGDDSQRFEQLLWALTDPSCQMCWGLRGGYGSARLLDRLPPDLTPRPLYGFSDLTALQMALYQRGWKELWHAPTAQTLLEYRNRQTLAATREASWGRPSRQWSVQIWQSGILRGPMIGGNVNVIAGLCGTAHQLQGRGHVIFLEEVREVPYRLDHNLTQLRRAGCFDGVLGFVLGQFSHCGPAATVRAILRDILLPLGVPVVAGAPAGHGNVFRPFCQGGTVALHNGLLKFPSED